MKVKIQIRHENAVIPKRASDFAGGWDVTVTEIIQESSDFVICNLGFSLQPPDNYKVTLVPRSSLTKTHWVLQNSPGLGDPDFMGEYSLRFRCIPIDFQQYERFEDGDYYSQKMLYEKFPYKIGDCVGQLYLEEIIPIEFEEVKYLDSTNRKEGGFGSTNK